MVAKLARSQEDRIIGGVCSGLGRYFGVDPVLIRLGFVLLALVGGGGVLAYLVLMILMPLDTCDHSQVNYDSDERRRRTSILAGVGMVLFGVWHLLGRLPALDWLSFHNLWPLTLIGIGLFIAVSYLRD